MPSDDIATPLPSLEYRRDVTEYAGFSDIPRTVQLLCLASVAAFISALPSLLFLFLGIASLLFVAAILQGLTLAFPLMWVFRTVRLRNRRIGLAVTIYAALLAVAFLHLGFYLRDVFLVYRAISNGSSRLASAFPLARGGPFTLYNLFIQREVGLGGFGGYAIYRVRNNFYSTSTFVLAVVTPMMAWRTCKRQLKAAFCTSCATWMGKPRNSAVVPTALRQFLIETVQSNDVEKALALTRAVAGIPLGASCAIARQHQCSLCGNLTIDVIQKGYSRRNRSEVVVLAPMEVSQEFADALRSDPVLSVDDGESDAESGVEPDGDEPTSPN